MVNNSKDHSKCHIYYDNSMEYTVKHHSANLISAWNPCSCILLMWPREIMQNTSQQSTAHQIYHGNGKITESQQVWLTYPGPMQLGFYSYPRIPLTRKESFPPFFLFLFLLFLECIFQSSRMQGSLAEVRFWIGSGFQSPHYPHCVTLDKPLSLPGHHYPPSLKWTTKIPENVSYYDNTSALPIYLPT